MKTRNMAGSNDGTPTISSTTRPPAHQHAVARVEPNQSVMARLAALTPADPAQMGPTSDGASTPYVAACSTKSSHYQDCVAAGLREGDLYLVMAGQKIKLDPLRFHILACRFMYTKTDTTGNVIRSTTDAAVAKSGGFDETYLVILAIHINGRIVLSRSEFKSTKANCVRPGLTALRQASHDDWKSVSEAHAASAGYPLVWGRFTCSARTQMTTAKSSGNRYYKGECQATPSTAQEREILDTALASEEFADALEIATASYESRIRTIEAVAVR